MRKYEVRINNAHILERDNLAAADMEYDRILADLLDSWGNELTIVEIKEKVVRKNKGGRNMGKPEQLSIEGKTEREEQFHRLRPECPSLRKKEGACGIKETYKVAYDCSSWEDCPVLYWIVNWKK